MIILTFHIEVRPDAIHIDSKNMLVRPFKPRPLQCFNCLGYGHASKICKRNQLCANCSYPKEQDHLCEPPLRCINCKEAHSARDRNCSVFKREQAAVIKANDEHTSIGYAKKLLSRKLQYSEVVRVGHSNSSSNGFNYNTTNGSQNSGQSVRPKLSS